MRNIILVDEKDIGGEMGDDIGGHLVLKEAPISRYLNEEDRTYQELRRKHRRW